VDRDAGPGACAGALSSLECPAPLSAVGCAEFVRVAGQRCRRGPQSCPFCQPRYPCPCHTAVAKKADTLRHSVRHRRGGRRAGSQWLQLVFQGRHDRPELLVLHACTSSRGKNSHTGGRHVDDDHDHHRVQGDFDCNHGVPLAWVVRPGPAGRGRWRCASRTGCCPRPCGRPGHGQPPARPPQVLQATPTARIRRQKRRRRALSAGLHPRARQPPGDGLCVATPTETRVGSERRSGEQLGDHVGSATGGEQRQGQRQRAADRVA